jgi:transcriptional antiterminator RfaH
MLQARATVPAESAAPGTAWYVCLTKPRQEAMAAKHIQEQGYDFYMPTLRRWQRLARGWRYKDEVLFPRYAFARPGRAGQGVGPLRSTPGVTTLVRFGPVLALLPDQHLQGLRQVVADSAQGLPQHPMQPGQHVVFVEGPLKGLQGLVNAVANQRVQLMLTLLGRQQTINVPMRILAAA